MKMIMFTPVNSQFYYIMVGFKRVGFTRVCYPDVYMKESKKQSPGSAKIKFCSLSLAPVGRQKPFEQNQNLLLLMNSKTENYSN